MNYHRINVEETEKIFAVNVIIHSLVTNIIGCEVGESILIYKEELPNWVISSFINDVNHVLLQQNIKVDILELRNRIYFRKTN